ncbi:tetratricopeptide repeat protein [Streptomyces sp. NPDC002685]|uniref:tetratricopeptide repeat protein n=1 Tax=Streptomyces sp. NPDC002685 TaxID=3154540 RepID=UPI003321BAF4
MGLVRALLPLSRAAARLSPRPGRRLHGAALTRCLAPDWVLLRPASPTHRLAWAEEAVAVYRALVEAGDVRPRDRDLLARNLTQHASALLLVGRSDQACTSMDASLAVPGARWSPAQRAHLLHLRAQAQFDLARLDEALGSTGECVAAYRRLLPTRRERALGGLPGALRTYALVLQALDRTEESVAVYEECAGLLRAMSVRELGRVTLVRARVLSELVAGLRSLGRYAEALSVGREARDAVDPIMVWALPDYVRPLRVRLFADLAGCLAVTGDLPAARTAAEEAVAEARALTGRDRAAGEPWLVVTLECLGDQLSELEEHAAELTARREVADLRAALAAERPDVHDPLLAACLERLADCHEATGDRRAAVGARERAVAAYRRAGGLDPAVHEPELARALSDLSLFRQGDGDLDGAVRDAREAVALTRHLAESDWQTNHALTARRLRVLGRALRRSGDHAAAVACYEESESILDGESTGPGANHQTSALAATRSGLALALDEAAGAHLTEGRSDAAVAALCSLLALTRRTDQTSVHARCVAAFAHARAEHRDTVVPAWRRATGEDFPTFVYRWSGAEGGDRLPNGS